ncbi:MAG TPA: hypothetical protein VK932_26615 [Kofleriaceae bacterium]|nr:hypothetical protein [Kofleriaceae bacterium]
MLEIFQPLLQLEVEPDGEYSLYAVTICPNSGFSAGRARLGAPPTVRLTAETFPVMLDLRARRGRSLQMLTPVRHHLRNLKLGPEHGKTMLTAFAMLRGDVVGMASIEIHASQQCPRKDRPIIDTTDWYAWISKLPPGPASFHITGTVLLPTPGFDARLVKAAPQGINPKELILDVQVAPRPGLWPQVITPVTLRYDERAAGIEYEGVLIREPDGDATHIEVEVAH